MNRVIEQLNATGTSFVQFALPMLIQVSLLIVVVLALDWLLRKRARAQLRYWLWMLVLLKLVLPTSLAIPTGIGYWITPPPPPEVVPPEVVPLEVAPRPEVATVPSEPVELLATVDPLIPAAEMQLLTVAHAESPVAVVPMAPPAILGVLPGAEVTWQGGMLLLWMVVVTALVAVLIQRSRFVSRLIARASDVDADLLSMFESCRDRLRLKRHVGLKLSADTATPAVCGLFHPVILIPQHLPAKLDSQHLRAVLLHELAHVKRGDLWVNLLQALLQVVYFYNPLLWLANTATRRVREQAVDEMVLVALAEDAESYPDTLLAVARLCIARPILSLRLIGVVESKTALTQRIKHILARPLPKTARLGVVGLMTVLIAAAVLLPMAGAQIKEGDETGRDQGTSDVTSARSGPAVGDTAPATTVDDAVYDHLLYLRHDNIGGAAQTDTLVLASITPERFERREVFVEGNLHVGWDPVAAVNGKVYATKINSLISIDLDTGQSELICRYLGPRAYRDGRLYAIAQQANVLRVFDFSTQAQHDVCPVAFSVSLASFPRRPMAVSPNGDRLAFFQGDEGRNMAPLANRLQVVDLKQENLNVVGELVYAQTFSTGGGERSPGPPFVWIDNHTILLAYDVLPVDSRGKVTWGESPKSMLATMDVVTGRRTDVLELPKWSGRYRMARRYFLPCREGEDPRIVLGKLSQYRIDLKKKKLIEDNRMGGDFHWVRRGSPERLLFGTRQLFTVERIPGASVSPGGKRIAWITTRWLGVPGTGGQIRYFDQTDQRPRVIAEGWFPGDWSGDGKLRSGTFMWLTKADLRAVEPPEPPFGWTRFGIGPYPPPPDRTHVDERLDIGESLTMTISTDKQRYRLHEPVKLTVRLAANGDKEVTFPRPGEHGNPFGLLMTGPRSVGQIGAFGRTREIFATDPLVIKAGEFFQCTRIIEPDAAGVFKVKGAFRGQDMNWKGQAEAEPISFVVERSADDGRLLKEKFNRLIALGRKNGTFDYGTIFDLEDEAVPLLVAELKASADPGFRQRIGYALAALANADALPYFRSLLAGAMEHDQRMVLDGLFTMVKRSRSKDEALELLLLALKHANTQLRRGGAKRLAKLYDPQVKRAFEATVNDSDATTSTVAARYLAAYEGLNLADWLAKASVHPTPAHYVAARSFVRKLEGTWHLRKGSMPEVVWTDFHLDLKRVAQYQETLREWERWARANQRSSDHFFDPDRKHWPKKPTADPQPQPGPPPARDVPLTRQQSISGTVRDADTGEPVPGAEINFSTADRNRGSIKTDANGRYRVSVQPHKVGLHCNGTPSRWLPVWNSWTKGDEHEITVVPGQQVGDIDFTVRSAPPFAGRVLTPDGQPAVGVHVWVRIWWGRPSSRKGRERLERVLNRMVAEGKPLPPLPPEPRMGGGPLASGIGKLPRLRTTDAAGGFNGFMRRPFMAAYKHEAITLYILARTPDGKLAAFTIAGTTSIDPALDPIELRLAPTGAAEFNVVDPDGRPVPQAAPRFSAKWSDWKIHSFFPLQTHSTFDALGGGRFRATGLLPGWEYKFEAVVEGFRRSRALPCPPIEPGKTVDAGTIAVDWWDERAVPELIEQLGHDKSSTRETACRLLGELGPAAADAVPALIKAVRDDPQNTVRYSAAEALGAIGDAARPAVPDLIRALETDKLGVPREAAKALGRIGDPAALPALRRALDHREKGVRENARQAIVKLEAAAGGRAEPRAADDES